MAIIVGILGWRGDFRVIVSYIEENFKYFFPHPTKEKIFPQQAF